MIGQFLGEGPPGTMQAWVSAPQEIRLTSRSSRVISPVGLHTLAFGSWGGETQNPPRESTHPRKSGIEFQWSVSSRDRQEVGLRVAMPYSDGAEGRDASRI